MTRQEPKNYIPIKVDWLSNEISDSISFLTLAQKLHQQGHLAAPDDVTDLLPLAHKYQTDLSTHFDQPQSQLDELCTLLAKFEGTESCGLGFEHAGKPISYERLRQITSQLTSAQYEGEVMLEAWKHKNRTDSLTDYLPRYGMGLPTDNQLAAAAASAPRTLKALKRSLDDAPHPRTQTTRAPKPSI